jgi:hypothetical protein
LFEMFYFGPNVGVECMNLLNVELSVEC